MALKRVTAPANYPVSLDEAKAHLRVDYSDDDPLITAFIKASTGFVEGPTGFIGRALIDQTWDLYLDGFPLRGIGRLHRGGLHHRGDAIEIPLPPLIEIIGVFYLDSADNEQTLATSSYIVDPISEPARLVPARGAGWPVCGHHEVNSVRIRFRAGYLDMSNSPPTDNVPFEIKAAILMHVADLYANRETQVIGQGVTTLPWAAEQLLRPKRVPLSLA
jgi:uncharacterized phiE125 gp8 family phage protein